MKGIIGRFYGRSSRENLPLKSSRGLHDTFSIYYLLQQSHFVGSIMFSPAGGFFEKFTINHLTSPKPTTALSNRKKLSSFLVGALSMRSMLADVVISKLNEGEPPNALHSQPPNVGAGLETCPLGCRLLWQSPIHF